MRFVIGRIQNERASGVLYEERYDAHCTFTDDKRYRIRSVRSFDGIAFAPFPCESVEMNTFPLDALFPGVTGKARITTYRFLTPGMQHVFDFESVGPVEFSADCGLVMQEQEVA